MVNAPPLSLAVMGMALQIMATASATAQSPEARSETAAQATTEAQPLLFGATLETYYQFNWNRAPDRILALRAYDTRSNTFSLQQVALIVDASPDVAARRRFGARVDLQFGQATETVQGSPANEPRSDVYRHVWQAYGWYVFPLGPRGLQADAGKFASNLGYETNYAKDNQAFSRAFLFNFLPFYHSGVRLSVPLHSRVTASYMLTNGIQQTEEFNDFKSHQVAVVVKPAQAVSWTVNYYTGREQADGGEPNGPDGRFTVFDTYATVTPSPGLIIGVDVNHTTNQRLRKDPKVSLTGLGVYLRYDIGRGFAIGEQVRATCGRRIVRRNRADPSRNHSDCRAPVRRGISRQGRVPPGLFRQAVLPRPRRKHGPARHAAHGASRGNLGSRHQEGDMVMQDLLFITITLVFFVAAAAYVSACDRIR